MAAERPSSGWRGFAGLPPGDPDLHHHVQSILSRANFARLEEMALLARHRHDQRASRGVSCTIDTALFTCGFNNIVVEVAFSDKVYWVARIQHSSTDVSQAHNIAQDTLSEIATMRTVKNRTNIPVPQVFAFDVSSGEIGYPYTLMQSLPGRVLQGPITSHVPSQHLPKVAKQLAGLLFQLHGLTFPRLGRLWTGQDCGGPLEIIPCDPEKPTTLGTSLEWFYADRQESNRQALKDHADDPEWRTACWVLKTALPHVIIEGRVHGPFPLCHPDLHFGNLLFDHDYNLSGVIDWSGAQTVPVERLVISPEVMTLPGASDGQNDTIRTFRDLIRQHLRHLEVVNPPDNGIAPVLISDIFGSRRADIVHRCTYTFPHRALWDGRLVARLIYGDHVNWEQLVRVYGNLTLL